jgi:hypothetical protein
MHRGFLPAIAILGLAAGALGGGYPWLDGRVPGRAATETIASIPLPDGFAREPVAPGGFAEWLRQLPLRPAGTVARRHDGRPVRGQWIVHRVIDLDIGRRDLQQCADSVIRLRAEYLWARGRRDAIAFDFTSGDRASFRQWAQGYRPRVRGNRVTWSCSAAPDSSYATFREYLDTVFAYAGTASLERELVRVPGVAGIRGGDVFIRGGFPGHVVMVVDVARDPRTGRTAVLLAQGFMPAMDMHVMTNLRDRGLSPWYILDDRRPFRTSWGEFGTRNLRRFPEQG